MIVEQRFIAFDGKEFKTKEECINYEKLLTDIIPSLKTLHEICDKQKHCQECVFYNSSIEECIVAGDVPAWWELERIGG